MDDKLIDFVELLGLFKRRWWIIVVITVISTTVGIYKVKDLQPYYQGTMKVLIGKDGDHMEYYSENEMTYYQSLIETFDEYIKRDEVIKGALESRGVNASPYAVAAGLKFSMSEKTPLITISYSSPQSTEIENILPAIADELFIQISKIVEATNPQIITEPYVGTVRPNKKTVPKIAFAAGIVFSIVIILVLDYFDDKIRSNKRVKEILPIAVLGEIPVYDSRR